MGSMPTEKEEEHLHDWPNTAGFQTLSEQRTPIELKVQGKFPAATAGTLLRTGPSSYREGDFKLSHWFDGFSQVYRFRIEPQADGSDSSRVFYSSRRQVDSELQHVRKTGRLDGISFAQKRDPCVGFFGKLQAAFFSSRGSRAADASNVAVTIHAAVGNPPGAPLECRTDSTTLKTLDPATLEPIGITNQSVLHPDLSGPISSAHAQFDPVTGDCYNYNLQFGRFASYRLFCTSAATGETSILATITGPDVPPAYLHSFFLTQSYAVLCVWPAHFANGGLRTLWERNVLDAIAPFDPAAQTHWFVVDRRGGRGVVKRFTSPAIFAFHTINAWEEKQEGGGGGEAGEEDTVQIFADLDEYPSLDVLHRFYYENLVSNSAGARGYVGGARAEATKPSLARYRLGGIKASGSWQPVAGQKPEAAEKVFSLPSPGIGELPTINPSVKTKQHRYVYGVTDRGKSSFIDGLVKTDLLTHESVFWNREKHTAGEAIFVIDPERRDREDGGWLLSCVLDGEKGTSYLLCLDAETMTEVGRAECDVAVGLGFHGAHLANL